MGLNLQENYRTYKGEIELIFKDKFGQVIDTVREPNIIKVFAKEMLSHSIAFSKSWDPTANSGQGGFLDNLVDPNEEFKIKYMLFGASFDENGIALGTDDDRYFDTNTSGVPVAKKPSVGADNGGDLINPVPISDPSRPLKRIERFYFEPSYQPSDSPLINDDVRAMNNVLVCETTITIDEYNGFATSGSDFFTITEVALAGGITIEEDLGACECNPDVLFLEGVNGAKDDSILTSVSGSSSISIDPSVALDDVNRIKEGDQILIVANSGTDETYDQMDQVQPYYLVTSKAPGGRDIILDRTPVDSNGDIILGDGSNQVGIYRSSLRLFSHRILSTPFTKNSTTEVIVRWRINFN